MESAEPDDTGSEAQLAELSALVGRPFQRHGNDAAERAALQTLGGSLNRWKTEMADRTGVMRAADDSDLRLDELRVPKLRPEDRSTETKKNVLNFVKVADRADHAIGNFHNLMGAFDSMVVNEARDELTVHLSAEYAIIRALLEAVSAALWVLGPDDSDTRVLHALQMRFSELQFAKKLPKRFAELNGDDPKEFATPEIKFIDGQLQDLKKITSNAGLDWGDVAKETSPSSLIIGGAMYAPDVGSAVAFWYWSTASSLAHGEPSNMTELSDLSLIGVDFRNEPVALAEPSLVSILAYFKVTITLINAAHALWNRRAGSPPK